MRVSRKYVRSRTNSNHLTKNYTFGDRSLGAGSFGTVYLATNKKDKSIQYAVKCINIEEFTKYDIK